MFNSERRFHLAFNISPSDGSITTCGNTSSERNVVKSPVLSIEDDLSKAENFIDNAAHIWKSLWTPTAGGSVAQWLGRLP